MNRFFTKTFTRFLFWFLIILAIAFGVMLGVGSYLKGHPQNVDNSAVSTVVSGHKA